MKDSYNDNILSPQELGPLKEKELKKREKKERKTYCTQEMKRSEFVSLVITVKKSVIRVKPLTRL